MELQKNVPISGVNSMPSLPDSPETGGRPYAYPFFKMDVGDSFELEGDVRARLYAAAKFHSRKSGKKFVVRKTDVGARCWRTA